MNTDNQDTKTENQASPQFNPKERKATYRGEIKELRGERATVRRGHLQPLAVIAKFDNPKKIVKGKILGPDWKVFLSEDFDFIYEEKA